MVTKPIVGVVDLVGKTFDGVRASTSSTTTKRLRRVRPIDKRQSLQLYDPNEAYFGYLMNEKKKGFVIHSYLAHDDEIWVLGEKSFAIYNKKDRKVTFYDYSQLSIKDKGDQLDLKVDLKFGHGKLLNLNKDTIRIMKINRNNPYDMNFVYWCKRLIKID